MKKTSLPWLWLTLFVVLADLGSKYWANTALIYADPVAVFPGFDLRLLYNRGAAFSFLSEAGGWQRWFFVIITLGVCSLLVAWLNSTSRKIWWLGMAMSLVLGGALGNLYDRLHHGYVVDFISIYYAEYHFPAFNLADSAITLGAIVLVLDMLFWEKHRSEPK